MLSARDLDAETTLTGETELGRPSLNPLVMRGTAMPSNLLLMTKLLVVCFMLSGQWASLPRPFLPYLGVLDQLGSGDAFEAGLKVVFIVAAALLLMNRSPRTTSFVLGTVILAGMLASRPYFENNRAFAAMLFLLAGLSDHRYGAALVRWQVVLVYFAAALNKLLDVGWRSGQYFEHLAALSPVADLYARISDLFPGMIVSVLLAWGVILTEFALAGGFLVRRLVPIAIWVGAAYHSSLVLTTGRTFGIFWYAAIAAYLAFVQWPPAALRVAYPPRSVWDRLRRVVQLLDADHVHSWERGSDRGLRVSGGGATYSGLAAVLRLALALPATYLAFYAIAALPNLNHRVAAGLVLLLLASIAVIMLRRTVPAARASRKGAQRTRPPIEHG
jgi:hypothetical protein